MTISLVVDYDTARNGSGRTRDNYESVIIGDGSTDTGHSIHSTDAAPSAAAEESLGE
jgi:hypothetical protein